MDVGIDVVLAVLPSTSRGSAFRWILLASIMRTGSAAVFGGSIHSSASWHYVARFAFHPSSSPSYLESRRDGERTNMATISVVVDLPKDSGVSVLMYHKDSYGDFQQSVLDADLLSRERPAEDLSPGPGADPGAQLDLVPLNEKVHRADAAAQILLRDLAE